MPDYTQNAQQVLKDGQHFADTHSPEAAAEIVRALNGQNASDKIATYLDAQADKRPRRRQFTQGIRFAAQEVRWHGYVGYTLSGKDGAYCGHIGMAYPCDNQEDGWRQAIDWLRAFQQNRPHLVHTFEIKVRHF